MKIKKVALGLLLVGVIGYSGYTIVNGSENVEEVKLEDVMVTDSNELYGILEKGSILSTEEGKTNWVEVKEDTLVYYNGMEKIDEVTNVYGYVNVLSGEIYHTTILYNVRTISYEEAVLSLDTKKEMKLIGDYSAKDLNPNIRSIHFSEKKLKKDEKVKPVEIVTHEETGDLYAKVENGKGKTYFVKLSYLY